MDRYHDQEPNLLHRVLTKITGLCIIGLYGEDSVVEARESVKLLGTCRSRTSHQGIPVPQGRLTNRQRKGRKLTVAFGVACAKGGEGGLHLSCGQFDSDRLHKIL